MYISLYLYDILRQQEYGASQLSGNTDDVCGIQLLIFLCLSANYNQNETHSSEQYWQLIEDFTTENKKHPATIGKEVKTSLFTCFSIGNEAPVDNSWLYRTQKFQKEHSTWQILVLTSEKSNHLTVRFLKMSLHESHLDLVDTYPEAISLTSSAPSLHFPIRPVKNICICNFFTLRVRSQVLQKLEHCISH